jgi:prepilin-type N-terminal cleavage/methylation domain-containing protein
VRNIKKRGFSLIEIMIVILIMGVLVGVIGSLMGGFVSNFEITDDQTIARRRAQDVFNILQIPIQNAGLGLPADNFNYYFAPGGVTVTTGAVRVQGWWEPVSVDTANNVLRVVYSVPAGMKTGADSSSGTDSFSSAAGAYGAADPTTGISDVTGTGDVAGVAVNLTASSDVSGVDDTFVTFPGIHMHPAVVTDVNGSAAPLPNIVLSGKRPRYKVDSEDVIPRNVVYPFHDVFSVKAGMAFVDETSSVFVFADDVLTVDLTPPTVVTPTLLSHVPLGFRVEGVKAIRFDGGDLPRTLTVRVVTEGDSADSARNKSSQMSEIEKRWPGVTFNPDIYYEEFTMSWRTRNVETPPH